MKKLVIMLAIVFLIPHISFSASEPEDCNSNVIENLFSQFDYWMKNHDHKNATESEDFANFPSYDDALVRSGASYKDYLCLADYANVRGYNILILTKESGYYYQISFLRKQTFRE